MYVISGNDAPYFTADRIRAALAGEFDASMLSTEEREYFDEMFGEAMGSVMTPVGRAFWPTFEGKPNTDL